MKSKSFFLGLAIASMPIAVKSQNFEWAKRIGGLNFDHGTSVTTDVSGNVYTTGYFVGTVDFDPGPGIFNLNSSGEADIFISKLDANGNFMWAKQMGGISRNESLSITTDNTGNVFITGLFVGTADFDPGPGTYNLTSPGSEYHDAFICKLNSNGNFIWAKQMGGTYYDVGVSIMTDALGNVYTTGYFTGTVDFDPGPGVFTLNAAGGSLDWDVFISKLDISGNFLWAKQLGGISYNSSTSVATDAFGNVYTTGRFEGTVDFDPGFGTFELTSTGIDDVFISKLDESGNFLWAKTIGGEENDSGLCITTDDSGNVYTIGNFRSTADFDPGPGVFNLSTVLPGYDDIFISKLDASGNFLWAKQIGGEGFDWGRSIATDNLGNVYVTGYFSGTADFDPGMEVYNLNSVGGADIFIAKLDASGSFLWAIQMGGTGFDESHSITTDASGNLYTTGSFYGTVDFNPGGWIFDLTSAGQTDIFIHKITQPVSNIKANNLVSTYQIFPNPTDGWLNIDLGENTLNARVVVRNTLGQEILRRDYYSTNQIKLVLETNPGIYFLEITVNNQKEVIKIVKQ
ncbi:MAG: SBBP repeat-containing protein [Saprospiraceae bacterium]|nr:SBBP repeat-containing protein [Saprospiraceae bacterium]